MIKYVDETGAAKLIQEDEDAQPYPFCNSCLRKVIVRQVVHCSQLIEALCACSRGQGNTVQEAIHDWQENYDLVKKERN